MDIQRILILLGLGITSYLLILAWNEDYKQGARTTPDEHYYTPPVNSAEPSVPLPESQVDTLPPVDTVPADTLPQLESTNTTLPETSQAVNSNRIVHVTTDVFNIEIDKLGGDIVSGALPKFPTSLETLDEPFVLLDPVNLYSAQSGLIGKNGTDTAAGRPLFSTTANRFAIADADELTVDLFLPAKDGVRVTKRFTFRRNDYLMNVEYIVDNQSAEDWGASMYSQIKRDGRDPQISKTGGMGLKPYTGGATFVSGAPYTKLGFQDIEEAQYKEKVEGGYMAMVQHYFVSAWVPADNQTYSYHARKLSNQDVFLYGLTGPTWIVKAGQRDSRITQFYMGPKDQYRLEEISPGLNLTVDYGFLWWLAQPLFYLLTIIHGVVSNWGIAIILLTIIVKSLLYPLSAASFRSMAKMRKLQPEMARLKDRFGDDKQQFSQAMMDLYKKEGANPLGGCLPMLLQMPVFLALYWSLMESVELRQAPFFLWIHDLSVMDPYFVLPILMGSSMFLVQMMQPEPPDPVQAKVFKIMPIMFTFFFLWFPSGLVLYWLANNLLSILQQWYVTRQLEKAT